MFLLLSNFCIFALWLLPILDLLFGCFLQTLAGGEARGNMTKVLWLDGYFETDFDQRCSV